MRPAIVSGIVTGDVPVSYWSKSLVTVPEVLANVNSVQFLFGFESGGSLCKLLYFLQ